MRKLLLLFALFAIGAGCSSPVAEVEEADPNVANLSGEDCDALLEANPDPNSLTYLLWEWCISQEG